MSYLQATAQAQFDANGRAVVVLGPTIYGVVWDIRKMVITTTSEALTECRVYRGSESFLNMVDGSRAANQDVSDTQFSLASPDKLMFVWEKGSPGTSAIARVEGEQTVRKFSGISRSNRL